MANLKQAPKLYHTGKKHQGNFYQLPQDLMDIVFNKLDGKCGNQIKLMCVLLGTQGNGTFGVSEKWICERTGMVQQTYNKARKALIDRGWLKQEDGKLFVLISFIYAEGTTSDCVENVENKDTISEYEGTTSEYLAQSEIVSEAQYDVVYNIKGIEKDNKKIINSSFSANAEKEFVLGESEMEKEDVAPVQTEGVKKCKKVGVSGTNDKGVIIELTEKGDMKGLFEIGIDWDLLARATTPEERNAALGF